jgi:hypothetical protein
MRGSLNGWRDFMDYGLYGLGSKLEHWAQMGSALFCKAIILVSTRLLGISRTSSFKLSHCG